MKKAKKPISTHKLSAKLDAELEQEVEALGPSPYLGFSTAPEDMIYLPEGEQLDPNEWLPLHLGALHPAENVLRAILENSLPGLEEADREARLRRALVELFDFDFGRGRPRQIASQEVALIAMAETYWVEYCKDSRAKISVSEIVRKVFSDPRLRATDPRESTEKNFQDEWVKRFNDQKERLLKRHTGAFEEAQIIRTRIELRIINDMKSLGFWSDEPE